MLQRMYTFLLFLLVGIIGPWQLSSSGVLALVPPKAPVSRPSVPSVTAAAIMTAFVPFLPLVQAVTDDDYEYGAVNAPIGLAVGGGLLAIGTALLPIALRSGEEAFEEIKDRDATTFGKRGSKDVLQSKKKK
jgi:hypothetical protein